MKRLFLILAGFALCPYALAGVSIVSSSLGGVSPAGPISGVASSKTLLLDSRGPAFASAKVLVVNGLSRQEDGVAMAPQVAAVGMAVDDAGLFASHGKRSDRQSVSSPSGSDSSYESYAMMAAGMCAIGFLARRRKMV